MLGLVYSWVWWWMWGNLVRIFRLVIKLVMKFCRLWLFSSLVSGCISVVDISCCNWFGRWLCGCLRFRRRLECLCLVWLVICCI